MKKDNFTLVDSIESDAYLYCMVSCILCDRDLDSEGLKIEEPSDPMLEWAKKFGASAKHLGWSVSETGGVLCPECGKA